MSMATKGSGEVTDEKKVYTCEFCNKDFTNGRAYGGHKRAHLQQNNNKKQLQEVKNQILEPKVNNQHNDNQSSVSPKFFCSKMSSQGHMKFIKKGNGKIVAGNCKGQVKDLLKALPSWSTTRKRGRKSSAEALIPRSQQHILANNEINSLMELANHDKPQEEHLPPKKRKMQLSTHDQETMPNDQLATPMVKYNNKGKEIVVFASHDRVKANGSAQALEGQKINHIKADKGELIDEFSCSDKFLNEDGVDEEQLVSQKHRCSICQRTFSKGQILGGHKRHCKGQTPSRQLKMFEDASSNEDKRAFSFDLNELPSDARDIK